MNPGNAMILRKNDHCILFGSERRYRVKHLFWFHKNTLYVGLRLKRTVRRFFEFQMVSRFTEF